jgi:phosphate transport system substrate-binding protein
MVTGAEAFCPNPDCGRPLHPVPPPRPPVLRFVLIGVAVVAAALVVLIGVSKWQHRNDIPEPLASAASPAVSASPAPLAYPVRLCGSSTMGERAGPLLLQAFVMRKGGAGAAPPDLNDVRRAISSGPTATAFTSLAAKTCDVGMASRQITPAERSRLRALGDMSSRDSEHVIGLDGITIVVNRANPVSALSIDQLRSIFAGSITNWSAVHGAAGAIHLYAPGANTGTVDSFKLLVMDQAPLARGLRMAGTHADVTAAVARDKQAIGFVALPYADRAKALKVSSGGATAIAMVPNQLTVGRETYPLSRRLYLYTAARPANPSVKEFVAFARSDEGQLLVDRAGFVGSTSNGVVKRARTTALPPNAPPAYVRLARTSRQSEFVFYFKVGSGALDNKAYDDIGRLVSAMSLRENRNQQIVLAGFADSTGNHDANYALSVLRAKSVQRELVSRGVKVKEALGFGDAMPIRDNSTEQGREKNRRVEIFVTFKAST